MHTKSFLLLLVRHLFLEAMHLFLVANKNKKNTENVWICLDLKTANSSLWPRSAPSRALGATPWGTPEGGTKHRNEV